MFNISSVRQVLGIHTELEKIFAEEESFNQVKAELMKVTSASALGMKLFGSAVAQLKIEDFSALVDAELMQLRAKAEVTESNIMELKDLLLRPTQLLITVLANS